MKTRIAQHRPIAAARGGFSLVEMLVATTLVVMMMLMFAQIYVAAIDSLGEQQAVARNDGKARLADILLRGDLDNVSFRSAPNSNQGLLPLVKDDPVDQWQRGFVYISENDQTNPNDDVLHFTASIKGARGRDTAMYYGRARSVAGVLVSGTGGGSQYSNHPDIDDGDSTNGVGASRDAEICYFVRGGNLYRRVLLIRDIDLAGVPGTNSAQPSNGPVEFNSVITPANGVATPSYFKAFDYSAYCRIPTIGTPATDSVRFLGTDALQNHPSPSVDGFTLSTESLGCSMTRFGFGISVGNQTATNADLTVQAITRARGTPIEYDSAGNFFGRPLHAETGSYLWQWPGTRTNRLNSAGLVYDPATNQIRDGATPIVDPDTTNTRATEDLLISNVEAFDIEVWDQGLMEDFNRDGAYDAGIGDLNGNGYPDQAAGFVQLGNSAPTGYFCETQRLNPTYGPGGATTPARNWVFDTGHPDMWTDESVGPPPTYAARPSSFKPSYRPLLYRLNEDTDGSGALNGAEDLNSNGILDPQAPVRAANFWSPSAVYSSGTVVFRVNSFGIGDSTFSTAYRCIASGEDLDGDGIEDPSESNGTAGLQYAASGTSPPDWPTNPGQFVVDNGVTWEAFDNRVGLQKIRITIRVRDPREDLPRQFSIIHSFANPTKSN